MMIIVVNNPNNHSNSNNDGHSDSNSDRNNPNNHSNALNIDDNNNDKHQIVILIMTGCGADEQEAPGVP